MVDDEWDPEDIECEGDDSMDEPPEEDPPSVEAPVERPEPRRAPERIAPQPRVFVPLVDQYIDGEVYRGKVEIFRLTPGRDARDRPILRETPILRVPLSWTQHELMAHEAVGGGMYRARVRNGDGAFVTHRDYDWRDDDTDDDDGVEVIGRRRSRAEPPDSPPAAPAPPAPAADVMQLLADARAEREAALARQGEVYDAQIAALKEATGEQLAAVKARADEQAGALRAEVKRLTGEVNRLTGELTKAERRAFEEEMKRQMAEARLEMRPATPAGSISAPAAQTLASLVDEYRRRKAEVDAIQVELGLGDAGGGDGPTEVDAAAMLPRVMEHFGRMSDMFGQFERFTDKFAHLVGGEGQ